MAAAEPQFPAVIGPVLAAGADWVVVRIGRDIWMAAGPHVDDSAALTDARQVLSMMDPNAFEPIP